MQPSSTFEVRAEHSVFRAVGEVSVEKAIALVSTAIADASAAGVRRLLIDATGLRGFSTLQTVERFVMGEKCAAAAAPGMKAVLVIPVAWIDPERFGVVVARNRGLDGNVFSKEVAALEWLLAGVSRREKD